VFRAIFSEAVRDLEKSILSNRWQRTKQKLTASCYRLSPMIRAFLTLLGALKQEINVSLREE
jgi:hypothetical protein